MRLIKTRRDRGTRVIVRIMVIGIAIKREDGTVKKVDGIKGESWQLAIEVILIFPSICFGHYSSFHSFIRCYQHDVFSPLNFFRNYDFLRNCRNGKKICFSFPSSFYSPDSTALTVGSPDAVMELLERVWTPAKVRGWEGDGEMIKFLFTHLHIRTYHIVPDFLHQHSIFQTKQFSWTSFGLLVSNSINDNYRNSFL